MLADFLDSSIGYIRTVRLFKKLFLFKFCPSVSQIVSLDLTPHTKFEQNLVCGVIYKILLKLFMLGKETPHAKFEQNC